MNLSSKVLNYYRYTTLNLHIARDMRGQEYAGMIPERAIFSGRLLYQDIQYRPPHTAIIQRRKQIPLYNVRTTPYVY